MANFVQRLKEENKALEIKIEVYEQFVEELVDCVDEKTGKLDLAKYNELTHRIAQFEKHSS